MAVMSTTTADRAVHDEFLDLIYGDQGLVDAEFYELIDASWTPPPPAPRALPAPADRPPPYRSLAEAVDPLPPGRSTAARIRPARQRSPPEMEGR